MSLLDPRFKYIPAINTDVLETFRRFGFKPTSDEERRERQSRLDPRSHKPARSLMKRDSHKNSSAVA